MCFAQGGGGTPSYSGIGSATVRYNVESVGSVAILVVCLWCTTVISNARRNSAGLTVSPTSVRDAIGSSVFARRPSLQVLLGSFALLSLEVILAAW